MLSGLRARIFSAIVGNGVGPRGQIVQKACVRIVHVLWNLHEQVLKIFIRLQTIRFRCFHYAVDRGANPDAVNGVQDTPIVAAYAERSDYALTDGVIYGYGGPIVHATYTLPESWKESTTKSKPFAARATAIQMTITSFSYFST